MFLRRLYENTELHNSLINSIESLVVKFFIFSSRCVHLLEPLHLQWIGKELNHSCVGHFICAGIFLHLYAGKLTLGEVKRKHLATAQLDPVILFLNLSLKGVNIISWFLFFIGLPTKFIQKGSAILKYFVELSYLNTY